MEGSGGQVVRKEVYYFATLVAKECIKIKQASQGSLGLSIPNPPAMLGSFALPIRRDAFSSLFQRGYPLVTFFPCSVAVASSQIGPKKVPLLCADLEIWPSVARSHRKSCH